MDDGASIAAMSHAAQTPEPYYANEDIEVLHEIITEAQEAIDQAKEPKPLPVQALFKAYDRILPQHGIDPDSDHHLSTFIFRVGGERGELSLLGKFHAILERMGIVLEFGDGDTTSAASTSSHVAPDGPIATSDGINKRSIGGTGARVPSGTDSLERHVSTDGREANGRQPLQQIMGMVSPRAIDQQSNLGTDIRINGYRPPPRNAIRAPAHELSASLASSDGVETEIHQKADRASARPITHSTQHVLDEDGEENEAPVAPRPSILTLLDRWSVAASRRKDLQQTFDTLSPPVAGPLVKDVAYTLTENSREGRTQQPIVVEIRPSSHPSTQKEPSKTLEPSIQQAASPALEPPSQHPQHEIAALTPDVSAEPHTPYQQQAPEGRQSSEDQREHERLMQLACRAREIFVASRAFNHWADKTARRLEREAVARRHMIRFRCFRGWSQGPSSQDDEAHRLRATTAVQKLRRAVAEHEEQLRQSALAASQSCRLKTILAALVKWSRHKVESDARLKLVRRSRVKAATSWLTRANEHGGMGQHASERHKLHSENKVIADWHRQADNGAMRDGAARIINEHRVSIACLAQWWDQAELHSRASNYYQGTLLEKARHLFEQWNLQARRQAFLWRTEYVAVRKVFEVWQRSAQEDQRMHVRANRMSMKKLKAKYSPIMTNANTQRQHLERLSSRACLYIMSNRLLITFEQTVEKRKATRWEAVKRHLAARYEQVSAARKRRHFFATLDRWRSAAAIAQVRADQARRVHEARETASLSQALSLWLDESARMERRHYEAQLYHALPTLAAWDMFAQEQEDMSIQAIDMVRTGKRIQFQKRWSMSALQHGGLAHTSSMVAHRYQREQRNRTLQHWRQNKDKGRFLALPPLSQRRGRLGASEGPRSALRVPYQRNPIARLGQDARRQSTGTFETPTRWTGQPLPMGSLFTNRPMPPVREADEERTPTSSNIGDDDVIKSPLRPFKNVRSLTAPRPSTTPRAPVPMHVEEEFRAQLRPTISRIPGSKAKSTGQETPLGALQPSRQHPGSVIRVSDWDESTSAPPASYSQSQPALAMPTTTWAGRPAPPHLRASGPRNIIRPAQRRAGTPSAVGVDRTSPKNSIFSGTSQSKRWDPSKSFNSKLR